VGKFNEWDGLIHNPDGSKEFVGGGKVGGINNENSLSAMQLHRKGADEDDLKAAKEEELKALKEAGAKEDAANNCVKNKMGKLGKLNEFDGLVHNADGTRDFVEGGTVGGANNYALA